MRYSAAMLGFFTLFHTAGCQLEEQMRQVVFRQEAQNFSDIQPASIEVCMRVDQIGQELLTHNPFLGVTPTFGVIGRPEKALFHPDRHGILISEGLVNACTDDDELAALLAMELANLVAEVRNARKIKERDILATASQPGNTSMDGLDPIQRQTEALVQQASRRNGVAPPLCEPASLAREFLQNTGIEVSYLDRAKQLLEDAQRSSAFLGQSTVKSPPPQWTSSLDR